uniref:Uncharacterized protein n=1 Tax=Rhizophora mucronata TaxID=61149 RepID=A0A2P2IYJ6_RHIMU
MAIVLENLFVLSFPKKDSTHLLLRSYPCFT